MIMKLTASFLCIWIATLCCVRAQQPDDKVKLNLLLQEIAWDTVSHHPMTCVMKP